MAGRKDYHELTPEQQKQARADRPTWPEKEFRRHSYWVDDDGRVAKKQNMSISEASFREYMDAPHIRVR